MLLNIVTTSLKLIFMHKYNFGPFVLFFFLNFQALAIILHSDFMNLRNKYKFFMILLVCGVNNGSSGQQDSLAHQSTCLQPDNLSFIPNAHMSEATST